MANDDLRIEEHHPSVAATPERVATPLDAAAAAATPAERASDAVPAAAMDDEAAATPAHKRFMAQMKAEDRFWAWKFIARCAICVLDIVTIACIGAVMTSARADNSYWDYFADSYMFPWFLIAVGISFVWSAITILVRLFRRPPRPVHPGLVVGIDLVLWLSFLVVVLAGIGATLTARSFGSNPTYLSSPNYYPSSYSGHYELLGNGTWVYVITYSDYGSTSPRYNASSGEYYYPPDDFSDLVRDCSSWFDSCAEQDAYINALWQQKPTRVGLDTVVTVCAGLVLALHFALFVQGCIDTHKRRQNMQLDMVSTVLQDMERRGLITVNGPVGATGMGEKTAPVQAPQITRPAAARFA